MSEPYYAEAFAPMEGRCFRMGVPIAGGWPGALPRPRYLAGQVPSPRWSALTVDSCDGHRDPLTQRHRV